MDQIIGLIATGALFFSFVAYCEARDVLQSTSPRMARIGGFCAGALTLALSLVACEILAVTSA